MKEFLAVLWKLVPPWSLGGPPAAVPVQETPAAVASAPAAAIPPLPKPPASVMLEMAKNREVGIDPIDLVYAYVRRGALLRRARERWLARSWADQVESPLSEHFREWRLPGEGN